MWSGGAGTEGWMHAWVCVRHKGPGNGIYWVVGGATVRGEEMVCHLITGGEWW